MHIELSTEILKTGETLHVEKVTFPDPLRAGQIQPFLGHKERHYRFHLEIDSAGGCDGLETYYYIGLLDDDSVVGNIMTVESRGVGILGHVHTRQDQRRKGICSAIMRCQMADFDARGGNVLLLGTGYQSAAYWIYHSFGFRDWEVGKPGKMRYDRESGFSDRFFAPAVARPVPAAWRHWPLVALLGATPAPAYLRSLTFGVWGVQLVEGGYIRFLQDHSGDPLAGIYVLESETGAVTACITWVPDDRWRRDVILLDLFAHPHAGASDVAELLRAAPLPSGRPLQCYADPRDGTKISAIEAVGFRKAAVLPAQFEAWGERSDVALYVR